MIVELTCLGIIALLCATITILVVRSQRETMTTYSRELGRILAQADESRKASFSQMQIATGRLVAVAWPQNHQIHRTSSGTIEGAQTTIEPHFADTGEPEEETGIDPTSGLDSLIARNGHDIPVARRVATPDSYDEHAGEEPQ